MKLNIESFLFPKIRSSSNIIFYYDCFMDVKKEKKIKAQEWVVMFDGQIKRSEKEIDSNEHHLEVNSHKNE